MRQGASDCPCWHWPCADFPSVPQSLAGRPVLMAGTALRAASKLASDMAARALIPARISSLFLIALPSLPPRCFNSSRMRYSSLGIVKLSRTSFGFLALSSFSILCLAVVAMTVLGSVFTGDLAATRAATTGAALTAGLATVFGAAVFVAGVFAATVLATGLVAVGAFFATDLTTGLTTTVVVALTG